MVCFLAIVVLSNTVHPARHNWVFTRLAVPFMLPGRLLSLDYEGINPPTPIEGAEKLELHVEGKPPKVIRTLDELRGNVLVDTPPRALAFVRLRSSPTTWFVFRDIGLELIERSRLDLQFTFGDRDELRALKTESFDFAGVTSHQVPILGKYPMVNFVNGHFEVKRLLYREGERSIEIHELTEAVETDGGWQVLSDRKIDDRPFARVNLFLPTYE